MNGLALLAVIWLSSPDAAASSVRVAPVRVAPVGAPAVSFVLSPGALSPASLLPAAPSLSASGPLPILAPSVVPPLLGAAQAATSQGVDAALALKKEGVSVSAVLASKDTKTITEYRGVPSRVEELQTGGKVFRHWVRDPAALEAILRDGVLRAGPVSYVEFTGSSRAYIKDIYVDLLGVFFTTPEHSAAEPRVMNEATPHYIDFQIPEGMRALSLDGDTVLMLPARPGTELPVRIVGSSRDQQPGL